jgi:enediyne biosynthesis protein E7
MIEPVLQACRRAISNGARIPPGPAEGCNTPQELLHWTNRQFERYGDIFKAPVHGASAYLVASPEYARRILRTNWENYKKGNELKRVALLLGAGLIVSDGEFWKRQRRMIQPAFRDKTIGARASDIASANAALLEKWKLAAKKKEAVNVTRDTSRIALEVILTAIFGRDADRIAVHFKCLSDETARDLTFAQTFRSLRATVLQAASERRKANDNSDDMLGMLLNARDRDADRTMTDSQLVDEIMTLIVAGHETTASTLNWMWYLLSQHPGAEQRLSQELNSLPRGRLNTVDDLQKYTYARQIIEETLRLYPPGWLISRRAIKDDWLGDYFVPAGTQVYISIYYLHRHPELWEAPDRFDPDRFALNVAQRICPLSLLPFSAGPRNCIGESLSRLEMQIHLLTIAKELQLSCVEDTLPELDVGVNLRSRHAFIMRPKLKVRAGAHPASSQSLLGSGS